MQANRTRMQLYKAVIFNIREQTVEDEQYVAAQSREQALAKVDIHNFDLEDIRVFVSIVGSY